MTMLYEFDVDILNMCVCADNELSRSRHSKVRAQTRQMHFCSCDLDPDLMTLICELDLLRCTCVPNMNFSR